jgi:hypothetical protein
MNKLEPIKYALNEIGVGMNCDPFKEEIKLKRNLHKVIGKGLLNEFNKFILAQGVKRSELPELLDFALENHFYKSNDGFITLYGSASSCPSTSSCPGETKYQYIKLEKHFKDHQIMLTFDDQPGIDIEILEPIYTANDKIFPVRISISLEANGGRYSFGYDIIPKEGEKVTIDLDSVEGKSIGKFVRVEDEKFIVQMGNMCFKLDPEFVCLEKKDKDIKKAFEEGKIIIFNPKNCDTDIYKMSLVNVDDCGYSHYAFISLNGKTWANGEYDSISLLINGYEEQIKIFNPKEYADFLKGEL